MITWEKGEGPDSSDYPERDPLHVLLAAGRTIRKDHEAHISGWWTLGIVVGILVLGKIMNLLTDWGSK